MCFTSLYHCVGDAVSNLGVELLDQDLSISKFDTLTRNTLYISPEQVARGKELRQQSTLHNGKIDEKSPEIQEFLGNNSHKISIQSDIYAVGSILFRILFGIPPPP